MRTKWAPLALVGHHRLVRKGPSVGLDDKQGGSVPQASPALDPGELAVTPIPARELMVTRNMGGWLCVLRRGDTEADCHVAMATSPGNGKGTSLSSAVHGHQVTSCQPRRPGSGLTQVPCCSALGSDACVRPEELSGRKS